MTRTGSDSTWSSQVDVGYWTPLRNPPPTPVRRPLSGDGEYLAHLRAYLLLRLLIGVLGTALPLLLLLGDAVLLRGDALPRGSLSAYYHSGMRDVFVGIIFAVGLFLVTYKVFERNLDNTLSTVAGLAAVLVAVFPTGRPAAGNSPSTPLQDYLGESNVEVVHYLGASVFIVSLGVLSYYFGLREGKRSPVPGRMSPHFWRRFHWTAAAVIAAAVAFIGLAKSSVLVGLAVPGGALDRYSLLIGEIVAVLAFGVSWLAKGLELPLHLGVRGPARGTSESSRLGEDDGRRPADTSH